MTHIPLSIAVRRVSRHRCFRFGSNANVARKKETYGAVAMQVHYARFASCACSRALGFVVQAQWTKALNLGHQKLTKDKPVDRQNPYTSERQVTTTCGSHHSFLFLRPMGVSIGFIWLQLSLAQRMGLVECPPAALTKQEWQEVTTTNDHAVGQAVAPC